MPSNRSKRFRGNEGNATQVKGDEAPAATDDGDSNESTELNNSPEDQDDVASISSSDEELDVISEEQDIPSTSRGPAKKGDKCSKKQAIAKKQGKCSAAELKQSVQDHSTETVSDEEDEDTVYVHENGTHAVTSTSDANGLDSDNDPTDEDEEPMEEYEVVRDEPEPEPGSSSGNVESPGSAAGRSDSLCPCGSSPEAPKRMATSRRSNARSQGNKAKK